MANQGGLKELDPQALRDLASKMVESITSPAYVEAMRALKSAPAGKRLDEAMRRLTPEALRAQGVPLPEGMRISSRYFESGLAPIELGEAGDPNLLTKLHAVEPEVINALDRLRSRDPQLAKEIIQRLVPDLVSPYASCACACAGAGPCGGAGGG